VFFQLGSLYSIYVAGETLHVLTDPQHYQTFFESSKVDFEMTVFDAVFKAGTNHSMWISMGKISYHNKGLVIHLITMSNDD